MNWGIVGTGRIAEKFASTIRAMKGEGEIIAGVASREIGKARAFGEKYGIPLSFSPYSEIFNGDSVDAVYIATPNNLHYSEVKDALEKGKHVLCEKPITLIPSQAEELYGIAKEKNLLLLEAYWVAFLPGTKLLRNVIEDGRIGEIKSISLQYGFFSEGARRERKLLSHLGGGALLDIGIYNLAIPHMLGLRNPSIRSTSFKVNEFGTDSWNKTILSYGGVEVSTINAIGEEIPRECVIEGTEGRIRIPDFQFLTAFTLERDGKREEFTSPIEINGFEYEVREVRECVSKGLSASPTFTPSDSLAISNLIYRIRRLWNMKFQGTDND